MPENSSLTPRQYENGHGDPHRQYNQFLSYKTASGALAGKWCDMATIKIDNSRSFINSDGKTVNQISDRNREISYLGLSFDVTKGEYGGMKEFGNISLTMNIDDNENLVVELDQHFIHSQIHSSSYVSQYEFKIFYKKIAAKVAGDNKTATQFEAHLLARMPGYYAPLYIYPRIFEHFETGSLFTALGNNNYSAKEQLDYLFKDLPSRPFIDEASLNSQFSGFSSVSSKDVKRDETVLNVDDVTAINLTENTKMIAMSGSTTLTTIVPFSQSSNGFTGCEIKLLYIGSSGTIKSGGTFSYSVAENGIFTGNKDINLRNGRVYKFLRYGTTWFLEDAGLEG
ncbi:hypothetical protein A4W74_06520 [Latilactobacillus curvatus]|uniref:hypothetical protein n=1 Tax=Latilactobacillus curvatus TaxID=28038 RepID=UPI0020A35A68|nr:hypothetical protein [Latilactobacillus curvatus]UTB76361.1 hypothetical protein A4W74_06520 [Latilactobacillus curvatus]